MTEIVISHEPLKFDSITVATYIETTFWIHGAQPGVEDICQKFRVTRAQLDLFLDNINKQLQARGLDLIDPAQVIKVKQEPDPEFVAACALLLDTSDKSSNNAKLKLAGISTRRWNALKNVPANKAYFKQRVKTLFKDTEDVAKLALIKNIETGDLASIKHFHEVTGIYRPNEQIVINLGVLIGRLMEILVQYLPSDSLLEVGDKFNSILTSAEDEVKQINA